MVGGFDRVLLRRVTEALEPGIVHHGEAYSDGVKRLVVVVADETIIAYLSRHLEVGPVVVEAVDGLLDQEGIHVAIMVEVIDIARLTVEVLNDASHTSKMARVVSVVATSGVEGDWVFVVVEGELAWNGVVRLGCYGGGTDGDEAEDEGDEKLHEGNQTVPPRVQQPFYQHGLHLLKEQTQSLLALVTQLRVVNLFGVISK